MRRIHVINRRTKRIAAIAIGLSLIAAACGDDDDDDAGGETATEAAPDTTAGGAETTVPEETSAPETTAAAAPETTSAPTEETSAPAAEAAMSVTYTLSDVAVWNDGSPITWEDFECTWLASLNTPESITTQGYDQIGSVTAGATDKEVVVNFNTPFAAWRTLFVPLLQNASHDDCNDVTADFPGGGPFTYGNNVYNMTEWTPEQIVFEVNPEYRGPKVPKTPKIVVVPAEDGPTLLKAGTVDFIYFQSYTGADQDLADPNVEFAAEGGGSYEGFYFNQDENCTPDETRSCAFVDDVFREAFYKSIDVDAVYQQIYAPFAQGLPRLECGPIAPGPYCDPVFTSDTYDPEGAVALLEGAGWTRNADGMWQNADGEAPEIHWMVSSGNPRREGTQAFLIPQLQAAGFNVIADNCEALPCVFEVRLPALKYDFTMYINTVSPDPVYITGNFACDYIPTEENGFVGQNNTGWCNQEATDELFQADATLDEAERIELVKSAITKLETDHVMIPLLQFPNIGAYRTDRVAGTQNNLAAYWAFQDWENFEDLDGDGQVVLGAEQYPTPDCQNPITSCANSSWYQWGAGFPQLLGPYIATNDQTFQPTELLEGEAVVSLPEG
jgi:peptide/nickel transport system substrate-binding protein